MLEKSLPEHEESNLEKSFLEGLSEIEGFCFLLNPYKN